MASEISMERKEIDQRLRLRYGIRVDGVVIIACVMRRRAEQIAKLGTSDTVPARLIEVIDFNDNCRVVWQRAVVIAGEGRAT